MALKEEEMFTIGEFGLEVPIFRRIRRLSESLIVSSEHKLYLFGKQFFKE